MIVTMPCRICWTKIIQDRSDADLVATIEKLFTDPLKRRALYFNLKYKQLKSDLTVVVTQRDQAIKNNMELRVKLTKKRRLVIGLTIGGFVVGISVGIGLVVLGAKIGELVAAWR